MEKIEWLIDKLRRQYDSAAGAPAMLTTLQLLQQELTAQTAVAPSAVGKIAVIMPAPQWNTNMDSLLDAYDAETHRGEDEQKMVFELEPYSGDEEEKEEPAPETYIETVRHFEEIKPPAERIEYTTPEYKPELVQARFISVEMPPPPAHSAYMPVAEPMVKETSEPLVKKMPEPVVEKIPEPVAEKTEEPKLPEITPLPAGETPPSITAVEMPKPVPDTDKKSLNDLLEKPASEMFVRFQEPIKDLKRAISINERYQYINNLFSGDEVAFDRSIKTINSFNVFSEAEYWIRRELATRYGWEEGDTLVQQFYELVSRRFS